MPETSTDPRAWPEGSPPSVVLDPYDGPVDVSAVEAIGTVVLLLAGSVERRWAADVAVELCAGWSRSGRRMVLADLHLEDPVLQESMETSDNLEGMVDLFLYGASLAHIAQPIRGGEFYLVPSGTYATDVGEIYEHPRWRKLVAGFRESNAVLALFVPSEGPGLGSLAEWASTAILLGPPKDPVLVESLRREGVTLLARMEPPPLVGGQAGSPDRIPEDAVAPLSAPSREALFRDPDLELPPPPARHQRRRRRAASVLVWVLLTIVLLTTVAYLVVRIRPDLLPEGLAPTPTVGSAFEMAPPRASSAATSTGQALPYSVQVRAFTSLMAASEDLAREQRRLPGVPVFISPEEIQGILYFKILAGLSSDTTSAAVLRDRLVDAGAIDPADVRGPWSHLQFSPLAFDLGEFEDPEEAAARSDSLLVRELPTYSTVVPYSDGSRRWRLYGGAYRDSASAARMGEMIERTGLPSVLTPRVGTSSE